MKAELKFTLSGNADSRQTGTFIVPAACQQLSLCCDLDKKYGFLIFVILKDSRKHVRFQKQLGISEGVITIGPDAMSTTMGGIPGEIFTGAWKLDVILFTEHIHRLLGEKEIPFGFTVSDEKKETEEVIGENLWADMDFVYSGYDPQKVYRQGARWYRGDLHTHTRLSDGKELPENASRKAEKMHLDYYIATEHNVVHTGWPETEVCVMPGVEATTVLGHANIFGLTKRPRELKYLLYDKETEVLAEDMLALSDECRENGWLFSVNHPFLYIWQWILKDFSLDRVDCLEIINDPTYAADEKAEAEKANRMAVNLADLLWADGYRICAIGGSDSHNLIEEHYGNATEPSVPGDPSTWLHMHDLTPQHVIEALKECRCYVTRHCRMVSEFGVCGKDSVMQKIRFGGEMPEDATVLRYEITLFDCPEKARFYMMVNGVKRILQSVQTSGHSYTVQGLVHLQKKNWCCIRFGAETEDGSFLFFGNPMTKGKKKHMFMTMGDAMEYVRQIWK